MVQLVVVFLRVYSIVEESGLRVFMTRMYDEGLRGMHKITIYLCVLCLQTIWREESQQACWKILWSKGRSLPNSLLREERKIHPSPDTFFHWAKNWPREWHLSSYIICSNKALLCFTKLSLLTVTLVHFRQVPLTCFSPQHGLQHVHFYCFYPSHAFYVAKLNKKQVNYKDAFNNQKHKNI